MNTWQTTADGWRGHTGTGTARAVGAVETGQVRASVRLSDWVAETSTAGVWRVAVVVLVGLIYSSLPVAPEEVWSHVAAGQALATRLVGEAPAGDLRSGGAGDWAWYAAFAAGGVDGLAMAHGLLAMVSVAAVMGAVHARQGAGLAAVGAALAWLALVGPLLGTLGPRLLLSAALAASCGAVIRYAEPRARHRSGAGWNGLCGLAAVYAFWAASDSGVMWGLGYLALATAGAGLELLGQRGLPSARVRAARLAMLTATCVLASCAGAGGPAALVEAARSELTRTETLRPLGGAWGATWVSATWVASGLVVLVVWYQQRKWTGQRRAGLVATWPLMALGVCSAIWPQLLPAWGSAAAIFVVGGWRRSGVGRRGVARVSGADATDAAEAGARRTLLAVAVVLCGVMWSPAGKALVSGELRSVIEGAAARTPVFLGEQLVQQGVRGRLWVRPGWAGYLAARSGGGVRPWTGAESATVVERSAAAEWREVAQGTASAWDLLERQGVRWLVLDTRRDGALYAAAQAHPGCRVRYLDQQGALVEVLPVGDATGGDVHETKQAAGHELERLFSG